MKQTLRKSNRKPKPFNKKKFNNNNFNNRFNFAAEPIVKKKEKKIQVFKTIKHPKFIRFLELKKKYAEALKEPQYSSKKGLKSILSVLNLVKNNSIYGKIYFSKFDKTNTFNDFLDFYNYVRTSFVLKFKKLYKVLDEYALSRKEDEFFLYEEDESEEEIARHEAEHMYSIKKDFTTNFKKLYNTVLFNLHVKQFIKSSSGLIFFFSKFFNFYFFNKLSNFLMYAGCKTKADKILIDFLRRLKVKYKVKQPFDVLKRLVYQNLIPAIRTRQVGRKTIKVLGSKASFHYRVTMSLKLFVKGARTRKTSIVQALIIEYFKLIKGKSKLHEYNKAKLAEIQKHRLFTKVY